MSLLAELRVLFENRKYGVAEVPTGMEATLLLHQDDPECGVAAGGEGESTLIEVWQSGDLLCLEAAEIGISSSSPPRSSTGSCTSCSPAAGRICPPTTTGSSRETG